MATSVTDFTLKFLENLKKSNYKEWMDENRKTYQKSEKALKSLYAEIEKDLNKTDEIAKRKIFRINRDIRFSKDKTPYNAHRSVRFIRAGAHRRGGYYLRIEPGDKSMMAGGFFNPEPKDLLRIRKEFEMDAKPIRTILSKKEFKDVFGGFVARDPVKTAPKGFDKNDPNIDLIRLKSFFVVHNFTDAEVTAPDFANKVVSYYELLRPYFDYMSEILTTDLNGVSTLK